MKVASIRCLGAGVDVKVSWSGVHWCCIMSTTHDRACRRMQAWNLRNAMDTMMTMRVWLWLNRENGWHIAMTGFVITVPCLWVEKGKHTGSKMAARGPGRVGFTRLPSGLVHFLFLVFCQDIRLGDNKDGGVCCLSQSHVGYSLREWVQPVPPLLILCFTTGIPLCV